VAGDSRHRCPHHRPKIPPATSFSRPSWPTQCVRIARTASHRGELLFGQTLAASPAAERSLNRPWLKEKLSPAGAKIRTDRIRCRDSKKHKCIIRVVGINRRDKPRDRLVDFGLMLREPSLALSDPFQNLAHGHGLPRQGILKGPQLKCFLERDLTRAATVRHGEGLIHQHLKSRARRCARASRPSLGIAAAAFGEPAWVGTIPRLVAHDAGTSRRGSRPVRVDQRSIATST
jgi:hypothetical protein